MRLTLVSISMMVWKSGGYLNKTHPFLIQLDSPFPIYDEVF
jgi:hypothetical protein